MKTSLQAVIAVLEKPEEWQLLCKKDRVDPENAWEKALKVSKRVTTRKVKEGGSSIQWNGKISYAANPSDLLHELAHFQVAAPERRFEPDYGLGDGPETTRTLSRLISGKESQSEEVAVSLLGILWEAQLGFPFQFTLAYHNWGLDTDYQPALQQLQRYGLVVRGEPVAALRE